MRGNVRVPVPIHIEISKRSIQMYASGRRLPSIHHVSCLYPHNAVSPACRYQEAGTWLCVCGTCRLAGIYTL